MLAHWGNFKLFNHKVKFFEKLGFNISYLKELIHPFNINVFIFEIKKQPGFFICFLIACFLFD